MPSYFYRARDLSGRAHEGIEVAASEDEVLRALAARDPEAARKAIQDDIGVGSVMVEWLEAKGAV